MNHRLLLSQLHLNKIRPGEIYRLSFYSIVSIWRLRFGDNHPGDVVLTPHTCVSNVKRSGSHHPRTEDWGSPDIRKHFSWQQTLALSDHEVPLSSETSVVTAHKVLKNGMPCIPSASTDWYVNNMCLLVICVTFPLNSFSPFSGITLIDQVICKQ